jgi:osmotically-inducible protein OsmY
VKTSGERMRAVAVAKGVEGVKSVRNEIHVQK